MYTNTSSLRHSFLAGLVLALAGIAGCSDQSGNRSSAKTDESGMSSEEPRQAEVTVEELTRLAEQGDADAQFILAGKYYVGEGVPKDLIKAFEWWRKAAEQGIVDAEYNLAFMYRRGEGTPKDVVRAIEWCRRAAEHGMAKAQYLLGAMYQEGEGIPKDNHKAAEWYLKAAEQGNTAAQRQIGMMYEKGEGIPKDATKAVEWYKKAADQGHAEAMYDLGLMYQNGEGVRKDYIIAVEWYRKAADQGHAEAMYDLGLMYQNGEGVRKDYAKAFDWFQKAAAQGDVLAQGYVSDMYENGVRVPKDVVLAYAWLNLAVSGSDPPEAIVPIDGNKNLVRIATIPHLERTMSPAEIAEAQQLSSNWKKGETLTRIQTPNSSTAMTNRAPTKQLTSTAFFVSKAGHAITNNHVVSGCKEITTEGKGKAFQLLTMDTANDLALLQLSESRSDAARLPPDSSKLRQGQEVVVFGFPLNTVLSSGGNLTPGVVSALTGVGNNTSQIQITAPIQPGSSGSPVLDKQGNVIGVVSMKLSDNAMANAMGTLAQNVNFAVSGQTLASFLDAHEVPYKRGRSWFARNKSFTDLADEARKWTVVVECWK